MSAEFKLPKEDVLVPEKVIGCKYDPSGNSIGCAHSNPIIDTRVYKVQFPDGHVKDAANAIAENIYLQVDEPTYAH